jgi:glucan phosphoethanolaminetransferase (alkaline phosphatase superfamily)
MTELNKNDKRFLREWQIQTEGSRTGFFILYTIVWGIIFSFLQIALNYFISEFRSRTLAVVVFVLFSLFMGIIFTMIMYYRNQARYFSIRLKEKEGEVVSGEKTAP